MKVRFITVLAAILIVFMSVPATGIYALSDEQQDEDDTMVDVWEDDVYTDEEDWESDDFSELIPDTKFWGASENYVDENVGKIFTSCKVSDKDALMTNINLDDYSLNAYYVFGKKMGKYYGLSKVTYLLLNENKRDSDELRDCYDDFVMMMTDEMGEPDSNNNSVSTWETKDYTIQIGKGKFSAYTGYNNVTVGIVFKGKHFTKENTPSPEPSPTPSLKSNPDSIQQPNKPHNLGVGRRKMETYTTAHFTISVPADWSLRDSNEGQMYVAPDGNAFLLVQEEAVSLLSYLNEDAINSITKSIIEDLGNGIQVGDIFQTSVNGMQANIGSISKDSGKGFIMIAVKDEYIIEAAYLENKEYSDNIYDTAMGCFNSIKLRDEYSNSYTSLSESENEEQDNLPEYESSQFSGPMVTVNMAGREFQIHKSFKDAMDSYEAFYDSYFDAITGDNYLQLIALVERMGEVQERFDALEDADLTDAEMAYYIEIHARILQKMTLYNR